jgi:hypothetical protein
MPESSVTISGIPNDAFDAFDAAFETVDDTTVKPIAPPRKPAVKTLRRINVLQFRRLEKLTNGFKKRCQGQVQMSGGQLNRNVRFLLPRSFFGIQSYF